MNLKWQSLKKLLKNHYFQLAIVILLSFIVRLYRINYPLLDWHSFRQVDTASVTYRFTQEGIDLLRPRYHDLSSIQSGKDNPQGYRMTEFPFINAMIALLLNIAPSLDLVMFSRFVSIIFSLGTILALYWLVSQVSNKQTALISVIFLGLLPYSIYYSRVILPEPFMLFFVTLSMASLTAFFKKKKIGYWWLSWSCLALSLLLKPFTAFLGPVFLTLAIIYEPKFFKKPLLYLYPLLAFTPLVLWRKWIMNFPEGIPASNWLFNQDGIRFRPAWFRWLFWERLTKIMSGFVGVFFVFFNLVKRDRLLVIIASWWLGILIFFITIATGNVKHDYYQVLALPILSLTLARGAILFQQKLTAWLNKKIPQSDLISSTITGVLFITLIFLSWQQVKGFFNVNQWEFQKAGQEADLLLPPEAKVIAPAMGDTMFLFQTKRNGWPIGYDIDHKIAQGATHYISTNLDAEAIELEKKYITVKKTSEFLILDLTIPRSE